MIKWHDLKKNPMDLPTDSRNMLAYVDMGEVFDFRCVHFSPVSREWYYAADASMVEFEILKWAYVEYTEDEEPSPKADLTKLRDDLIKGVDDALEGVGKIVYNTKKDGESYTELTATALYNVLVLSIKYGIMKEFDAYGKAD